MAKRKPAEAVQAAGPDLLESRENIYAKLVMLLDQGRDLLAREFSRPTELEEARRELRSWRDFTERLLAQMFSDESVAQEFSERTARVSRHPSVVEEFDEFRESMQTYVTRLQSILGRLEIATPPPRPAIDLTLAEEVALPARPAEPPPARQGAAPTSFQPKAGPIINPKPARPGTPAFKPVPAKPGAPAPRKGGEVLVLQCGDPGAAESVAGLVDDLGLNSTILGDVPEAPTRIEEFDRYPGAAFAVVLLTKDEHEGAGAQPHRPRNSARQMFELGYLVGRLGLNKVCALKVLGENGPPEWDGVVFIDLDPFGAWRFKLAKEMRASGLPVDLNRLS